MLEGACEPAAEQLPFDPETAIGVVTCLGDEHASAFDAGIRVRDITYYLVRKRGPAIIATTALGTWETGPEWGGSAQLEGVLRAGPRDAVAVITIAEYTDPDSHSAHAAVYRLAGAGFTSIYQHRGMTELAGNRATVADCVPSPRASPPGPCERLVNAQPRHTAISWNGTAIIERDVAVP